jgi:ribosomal protein S18 acetylase RimI-like enzyme
MSIRKLSLPNDFKLFESLIPATFIYPENEAWNVQADERDMLVDLGRNMRRMWPMLRVATAFSGGVSKLLPGWVWEERAKPVGIVNMQRRGKTDQWVITNVGVLPESRRRGIARKLVAAAIEDIERRGGRTVLLDVIATNMPARTLYEQLGFEQFSGSVQLNYQGEGQAKANVPALPEGYRRGKLDFFDWETRFNLENRLIAQNEARFEPVEAARFRQPGYLRLILPLIWYAMGVEAQEFTYQTHSASAEGPQVVARSRRELRKRSGGLNAISIRLDPTHGILAPHMIEGLLSELLAQTPDRRIVLDIPEWDQAGLAAAKSAGFEERFRFHRMGLKLDPAD